MVMLFRTTLLLTLICIIALLPIITSDYYTGLITKIIIYSLFALSLQLLVGGTGLISLGHAAFFGIGAYTTILLSPEAEPGNFFLLLPCALFACALFAATTGALSLRTKGVYFIMVTLAFSQMAYYIFHDTNLGGGTDGIYMHFRPEWRLDKVVIFNLDNQYTFYLFSLICLLATWVFLTILMRSRFGAALTGIRVNEQRMRAAGYGTFKYKLTAYIIAGVLGGFAGILYVLKDGYVNPALLGWEQSGLVLLMVILGGTGKLWGAIVGAAALTLIQEIFQSHALLGPIATYWHLTFGLTIIVLVALLPSGFAGLTIKPRRIQKTGLIQKLTAIKKTATTT